MIDQFFFLLHIPATCGIHVTNVTTIHKQLYTYAPKEDEPAKQGGQTAQAYYHTSNITTAVAPTKYSIDRPHLSVAPFPPNLRISSYTTIVYHLSCPYAQGPRV